jgi:hypothetical protein
MVPLVSPGSLGVRILLIKLPRMSLVQTIAWRSSVYSNDAAR